MSSREHASLQNVTRGSGIEKPLPEALEAERFIVANLLLDGSLIAEVLAYPVRPDDFFGASYRKVYQAMLAIVEQQLVIDPLTLQRELERTSDLSSIGGEQFIAGLWDGVPRFSNVETYCKLVTDAAIRREVIHQAWATLHEAFDGELTVDQQIESAQKRFLAIEIRDVKAEWHPVGETAVEYIARAEEQAASGSIYTGLATGFNDLDYMTGGLQRKDLIVVAGRPSMGKSAFAMNLAEGAAMSPSNNNPAVAFFSAEMSKEQLIERMLSGRTRINSFQLRTGRLSKDQWRRVTEETGRLDQLRIDVDDCAGLSPIKMRHKLRQFIRKHKQLDLVVVDYFQALRPSTVARNASRDQELGAISGEVKGIAKEFDVPLVVISALSRKIEERSDKRPRKDDLRECGRLEYDMDVMLGIYREEVYNPMTEKQNIAEIVIGKQRMGPLGSVEMVFLKSLARFEDKFREPVAGYGGVD
jgi:replicative DNA helicase